MINNLAFVIFYAVLFGLTVGMAYMIPLYECNLYFPGKRFFVNGFVLIGTGIGPSIFGQFSYFYLNPN
jgi:hypothetical protein